MRTLVMTGGGTAGHCIPCVALLPWLEKFFDKIYYVGSAGGVEREIAERAGLEYFAVETPKLKRELALDNLLVPARLIKGVREAKKVLLSLHPSAVFSKGGYVALPVSVAAGRLGIPLVIHESDLTLGLANRLSKRYAREVLTSFPETAEAIDNGVYTGAPTDAKLFGSTRAEGRARYGFKGDAPVLLVVGGSSGSRAINREIRDLLPTLLKNYNVLHLCGRGNSVPSLKAAGYVQVEFEREMKYAYAAADIAVSRAGSNCIFELLAMKIPALLIPLPKKASRGDQIDNAKYFSSKGMFEMLPEEEITSEKLLEKIGETYKNRLNLTLSQQKFSKNGNEAIAARIIRAAMSR